MKTIDGSKSPPTADWAVLSPQHISRAFESGAAALFEAMTLRSIVVGLESIKDYTITVRQSTVHVRVR